VRTGKKVFFPEKLNLQGLSKRNAPKLDSEGKYLPNGQSAKSALNKSWMDAAFGQFFEILGHIAEVSGRHRYTSKSCVYFPGSQLSERDSFYRY
jgi:putative transposase